MKKEFIDQLELLGIKCGDVVLVHSSMKALNTRRTPLEFINDIITVLGKEGTLLIPALTYKNVNAKQPYFSVYSTEPCVGLIPRTFFHMNNVVRSLHPTHSVCAYGKYANDITSEHLMDRTPVGLHSPMMKLLDHKGKILFIGSILESCTFMHGIEEIVGTTYTLEKEYTHYIIENKNGEMIERNMYAHDFHGWKTEYQRIRNILHYPDINIGKVGQADCFLVDATILAEKAIKEIKKNPYYFVTDIRK